MHVGHGSARRNRNVAPRYRQLSRSVAGVRDERGRRGMISGSNSVKGKCQCGYEAAIQEWITFKHVADYHPAVRSNRIRYIKDLVSRRAGLDRWRSVKRTHIGSYAQINRHGAGAGIGKDLKIAGEVSVLRQIDFACHVQARKCVLTDDNFATILLCGAKT